jgi:hypothetical protein
MTPTLVLTWVAMHGCWRGVSRDGQREYWVQPVRLDGSPCRWWSVTCSAQVTERKLIGSLRGAQQLAEAWETDPSRIR